MTTTKWLIAGFCAISAVAFVALIGTTFAGLAQAYGLTASLILLVYGAAAALGAIGAVGTLLGRRWGPRAARTLATAVFAVAGLTFALAMIAATLAAFAPSSDAVPPALIMILYAIGPGAVAVVAWLVMRISAAGLRRWHDDSQVAPQPIPVAND